MANAWPTMAGYGWPSLYRLSLYGLSLSGLSLYGRAIALRARSWGCGRPWLAMTKVWPTMAGHYSFCKSAQLLQLDSIRKVVGTRLRGFYNSFVFLQVRVRPAHNHNQHNAQNQCAAKLEHAHTWGLGMATSFFRSPRILRNFAQQLVLFSV